MLRSLFSLCAILVIATAASAQCDCEKSASPECGIHTYVPEELQTPVYNSGFLNNGITTGQVEQLLQRFRDKFPDVTFTYIESKIQVNAVAFGDGVTFPRNVELWGGMAKHPAMGLEGIAVIMAHEVGHHYGNTDKVITNPTVDSNQKTYSHGAYCEDQSDFWGTRVGLRIVYNDLVPFVNANLEKPTVAASPDYDWPSVENADSLEYVQKVQTGINQAHSLLSGGLFVSGQSYLKSVTSGQNSFASSGCGHPQAGCRKALYESGKNRAKRAVCNDALEFFAGRSKVDSNAAYIFKKYGVELGHYGHSDGAPNAGGDGSVGFQGGTPTDADLIKGLIEEIKSMKQDLTEIKSKLNE